MYDIYALITSTLNQLKVIDEAADAINKGNGYAINLSTTATAGSTVLLYIMTPSSSLKENFIAQINSSIATITSYFANGTIAAASSYTAITAYNLDRNSTKTCSATFGMMPTSSGFSTYGGIKFEQYQAQMPAFIGTIQSGSSPYKWNLASATGYVIGVNCPSTAAVQINIKVYETT